MSETGAKTIGAKQVASYVILPGIMPRLKYLFTSGFGYIAFLMGQIYSMARLLPAGHPYLNPNNIGKFGLRHVIAEAANNIVFKRENIDQIGIFSLLLIGLVLLVLQFAVIILGLIFGPVMAQSYFVTTNPEADIAFILLDQVFGVPGLFNSCISTGVLCPGAQSVSGAFPWPFHTALHDLFSFYSYGILVIATLIFLYFVVVVILETATTGSPFGQRFQNIWVPIRLIMAIGLLIPLNHGLNAGQYITLFTAKVGSSFATNGWLTYNRAIAARMGPNANPVGERESLIGIPTPPNVAPLIQAMTLVHSCAFAHWLADLNLRSDADKPPQNTFYIRPYLVKNPASWMQNKQIQRPLSNTNYKQALKFTEGGPIIIRFGKSGFTTIATPGGPVQSVTDPDAINALGHVIPHCGDIRIPIMTAQSFHNDTDPKGPEKVQRYYYNLIKDMWTDSRFEDFARYYMTRAINNNKGQEGNPCTYDVGLNGIPGPADAETVGGEQVCKKQISAVWKQTMIDDYKATVEAKILDIWNKYVTTTNEMAITQDVLDRGWGGAGIWFNTIAGVNGRFMDAVINLPVIQTYPKAMEMVREEKRAHDAASGTGLHQFQPLLSNDVPIILPGIEGKIADPLNGVFMYWNWEGQDESDMADGDGGNFIENAVNLIFGTEAMFQMTDTNSQTHPLAQLAMLGKGLVESSIRNVATATVSSAFGGLLRAVDGTPAQVISAVSGFIQSTAFIGLTAGLVLYYILPFLPFIYFFFAVGSWVKGIFEAMVAVPLWALAHMRIDGEGLPGQSANNGYFLLFEIFLRPILIVAGLVAAIAIFTAQVRVLNFIWTLVTDNLAGHEGDPLIAVLGSDDLSFQRSKVDGLFFTIIYAIIVYMMATAAFKLIDNIPKEILRWMSGGVSAFADQTEDPAAGLTRYAALGGLTAGQQMAGAIQKAGADSAGALGGMLARLGQGTR